ncbi:hypothetical protein HH214_04600 [Mucilaginibacter robiniae]|uniref:Lipocalin-like domain-containing protein n=1 Tax=Mucilaginibacter robiniae TaxID=2728022 RepID=A0A7L5DYC6_9SPHI|nr:hypothetical protein [Mucilaginibacter robiniae]QJD95208.1 hypothetical protein HH214_04600 [Mucilaginibacter robiniae]
MMKKVHIFLFIGLIGILSSCKQDPAVIPANLQNADLVGKWYLKSIDVQSVTGVNVPSTVSYSTGLTTDDYFEFKSTNNAATYSSSIIGKSYQGYYSANSSVSPQKLTFKSGDFLVSFNIKTLTKDSLIIYQASSSTSDTVTTTVTNYYNYAH